MILVDILGIILSLLFLIGKFWAGVLGRVMTGLIVGANSAIVPLYIREISPVEISGLTGSFN